MPSSYKHPLANYAFTFLYRRIVLAHSYDLEGELNLNFPSPFLKTIIVQCSVFVKGADGLDFAVVFGRMWSQLSRNANRLCLIFVKGADGLDFAVVFGRMWGQLSQEMPAVYA